jgi:hypothetical protein
MTRLNQTDTLYGELREIKRRLHALETAIAAGGRTATTALADTPAPAPASAAVEPNSSDSSS